VVAQRQGQVAALNMIGEREKFAAAPSFWSQHYDVPINYVGRAETFDELAVEGDIAGRDCLVRYTSAADARSPWRRSLVTSRAWRPKCVLSEARRYSRAP
jgi:hypothetical protein